MSGNIIRNCSEKKAIIKRYGRKELSECIAELVELLLENENINRK